MNGESNLDVIVEDEESLIQTSNLISLLEASRMFHRTEDETSAILTSNSIHPTNSSGTISYDRLPVLELRIELYEKQLAENRDVQVSSQKPGNNKRISKKDEKRYEEEIIGLKSLNRRNKQILSEQWKMIDELRCYISRMRDSFRLFCSNIIEQSYISGEELERTIQNPHHIEEDELKELHAIHDSAVHFYTKPDAPQTLLQLLEKYSGQKKFAENSPAYHLHYAVRSSEPTFGFGYFTTLIANHINQQKKQPIRTAQFKLFLSYLSKGIEVPEK